MERLRKSDYEEIISRDSAGKSQYRLKYPSIYEKGNNFQRLSWEKTRAFQSNISSHWQWSDIYSSEIHWLPLLTWKEKK